MLRSNFGKNIQLTPRVAYTPSCEQEVLEILDRHRGQRIRVIGRLHSWSKAIETDDVLLDLRLLNQVEPETDGTVKSVRVGAGCQIKRLLSELQRQKNWTLPSVGFITEQTAAGSISTGTHGSGKHSLSHYVLSVRIARYDAVSGKAVIEEIQDGVALRAARCSLGCLGVIVSFRMQCRDAYAVEEFFHEYKQLADVLTAEADYPLQQFYLVPWRWTYFVQHRREVDFSASPSLSLYHFYRFLVIDIGLHLSILLAVRVLRTRRLIQAMIRWIVPTFVIRDWRVIGPSNAQMVMEHELFRHIEIELFVRRSKLDVALQFLQHSLSVAGGSKGLDDPVFLGQLTGIGARGEMQQIAGTYCHHYPICVRKILADDTLISMASPVRPLDDADLENASREQSDEHWYSITLSNFEGRGQQAAFVNVTGFLTRCMSNLFGVRPHWGKLCPLSPSPLRDLYPRFEDFRKVCQDFDPTSVFRNRWTDELLASVARHSVP